MSEKRSRESTRITSQYIHTESYNNDKHTQLKKQKTDAG